MIQSQKRFIKPKHFYLKMRFSGLVKLIINVCIVLALLSICIDMMEKQQRLDMVMEHRPAGTERLDIVMEHRQDGTERYIKVFYSR